MNLVHNYLTDNWTLFYTLYNYIVYVTAEYGLRKTIDKRGLDMTKARE